MSENSETYAFKMQLLPGMTDEYEARHDALWPELEALLRDAGISDYAIWLDEETGVLVGHLTRTTPHGMDDLPNHPIMQRWWKEMASLMQTHPDKSPVATPLRRVFFMP